MNQDKMPFVEALENYKNEHFVPFHTPGHKIGHRAPSLLTEWMGPALPYDLGVMYALDDLHEPEGCLKEAQDLAAELYGAAQCWFSVNGTTALIEAMIMSVVGPGDTIIIPREAHRSVMSGLVLSGAKPAYLDCRFDVNWGVPLGASVENVVETLEAHPEAKAILLVYPNYYGIGVDLERIVVEAHNRGVIVLVDEAHGPHLPFSARLPREALEFGADLVAQSTHKSVGALTQTSMLFGQGNLIDYRRVTQMHQMLQSTSPNYIFLASLDMARHQLAMNGESIVNETVNLALQLRRELAEIPGIRIMDYSSNTIVIDDINCQSTSASSTNAANYDVTKVLIDARDLGLTGVEFEKLLRLEHIEVELVQAHHVLVLITIGDSQDSIRALVEVVRHVSETILQSSEDGKEMLRSMDIPNGTSGVNENETFGVKQDSNSNLKHDTSSIEDTQYLPIPEVVLSPRQALYSERERIAIAESYGRISGETISYYPPGIPFVGVGERITPDVLQYIEMKQSQGYIPNGADDASLETLWVIKYLR